MQIKMAKNGWNGTFLPGDESLHHADMLEMLASNVENGDISKETLVRSLRLLAEPFRECRQPERWYAPID